MLQDGPWVASPAAEGVTGAGKPDPYFLKRLFIVLSGQSLTPWQLLKGKKCLKGIDLFPQVRQSGVKLELRGSKLVTGSVHPAAAQRPCIFSTHVTPVQQPDRAVCLPEKMEPSCLRV